MTTGQERSVTPSISHSEQVEPAAESVAVADESVRKRLAIGLSPQRATAKAAPQRPPEESKDDRRLAWTLIGLVTAVTLVTVLLVLARMADAPTSWPQIVRSLAAVPSSIFSSPEGGAKSSAVFAADHETDRAADWRNLGISPATLVDFSEPGLTLGEGSRLDAYIVGPDVEDGVYRMRLWPENVAWVIVGPVCPTSHWIEAETLIDAGTPSGHAALVGRFQDDENLYLFGINGEQEFEVLLLQDRVWTSVQAPRFDAAINAAGTANTLALNDDGEMVQFVVNGKPLYQERALRLPVGQAGLAGRAGQAPVQIEFGGFQMSSAPCRESQRPKQ